MRRSYFLPSRKSVESFAIPVGAFLLSMILFAGFCTLSGAPFLSVFASIYRSGFGSWYAWQNSLLRAAPLMLCALCTALPARAGIITVGNEGAFVVGGLACAVVGLWTQADPAWVSLFAMAVAGAVAGGVWIASAAALQHYRHVNAVISSLLLNYIAIACMLQLVEGPLRDPESLNSPATRAILPAHQLGHLFHTRVHWGIVFSLVASLLSWLFLDHTVWGMKLKIVRGNRRAATLIGLPTGALILTASFFGGASAGLAGMVEVAAVQGRAGHALAAGYGYVGILVAFLARQSPLRIIVVSLILGAMVASGGGLQRDLDLPDASIAVFEGIVFLLILASEALYGRFAWFEEKEPGDATL
jgi:ABC-type uncharacterized transport system permease subunit